MKRVIAALLLALGAPAVAEAPVVIVSWTAPCPYNPLDPAPCQLEA